MGVTLDNGARPAVDMATAAQPTGEVQVVALDPATLAALETITAIVSNWPATQPVSGPLTDAQLRASAIPVSGALTDAQLRATAVPVTVSNPTTAPETGLAKDATLTSRLPASVAGRLPVLDVSADLGVTATGAAGAAVTLTLPAVAGAFHHIARLEIDLYTTVARAGAAAPVLVTTTNLPGSPVYLFSTAAAIGTTERLILEPDRPIRSSVVNTATTIVCPVVTSGLWRVTANYFAA
jgi:hypothetical protein